MAAVDLHAEARHLLTHIGEERLDDGDQQRSALARRLAVARLGMAVFEVQLAGAVGRQHATAFDQRLLRQQHAAHVGVHDDRVGWLVRMLRACQPTRLQALAGIGQRALIGLFGNAKPLQADLEARVVHHGEHARQALIGLADDPAGRAVEVHHAGRRALDAHLVLDGAAAQRVALARRAIGIGDELGHQQQADAFHPGRRIRQARQHQMHDVLAHVVLAAGDEDLAAADLVATVRLRLGAGAQQGEVGARLRLCQAHGAAPAAADQLLQIGILQFIAAVLVQRQHRALGQAGIDAKGQRRAHQHLVEVAGHQLREALAAVFGRPGHARPAVVDVLLVGLDEALRRAHFAVFQGHAFFVAVAIERRDLAAGVARSFFQHTVDQLAVQAVAEQFAMAGGVEQLVQHEAHVTQGSLVFHAHASFL